jgi:hypothetical protein
MILLGVRQAMPGHWKRLPGLVVMIAALNWFRHVRKEIKISI